MPCPHRHCNDCYFELISIHGTVIPQNGVPERTICDYVNWIGKNVVMGIMTYIQPGWARRHNWAQPVARRAPDPPQPSSPANREQSGNITKGGIFSTTVKEQQSSTTVNKQQSSASANDQQSSTTANDQQSSTIDDDHLTSSSKISPKDMRPTRNHPNPRPKYAGGSANTDAQLREAARNLLENPQNNAIPPEPNLRDFPQYRDYLAAKIERQRALSGKPVVTSPSTPSGSAQAQENAPPQHPDATEGIELSELNLRKLDQGGTGKKFELGAPDDSSQDSGDGSQLAA
jgi:hypothetical protein